ncbi:histone-like transcription factor and archaeal histone [Colletotrichum graminicola]|uniref:Histone-like transcription factor and archaeal histone n=1 Tax=Colletotrichum graminicola (strain M1.001 / M2 / FGSC 10212) TaxID=645133 RepID=E3QIC4_COLGM|nr:histone-like transcription factor and archaeal histone [Colletotrichum graminicola M1.001]EFQ30739.1 histone-like transcription factor and archaeal histone [Colletotrichum graminicola M1.001]WDK21490.1 histone-like transcription factor and archaeal histone [Colletotrichum graminicola]
MPPNNNAIPPRKEATGQPALPLARVKKIIGTDPDISICSNNAAFVITLATEMFIQHLAAEGHNMAKAERKPRRNVQYKDLATAVNHHDNLEFLEDIIPKTVPYKQIKDQAAAARAQPRKADQEPKKRQSTLKSSAVNGVNGSSARAAAAVTADPLTAALHSDDPSAQLEVESRQAAAATAAADEDEDVDMTG